MNESSLVTVPVVVGGFQLHCCPLVLRPPGSSIASWLWYKRDQLAILKFARNDKQMPIL